MIVIDTPIEYAVIVMCIGGGALCFAVGLCVLLYLLKDVLEWLLKCYTDIRNRMTFILQTETMIRKYQKHQKEIDEYLKRMEEEK